MNQIVPPVGLNNEAFGTVLSILQSTKMTHNQYSILMEYTKNLHANACSEVVQYVSTDIWNHIFDKIDIKRAYLLLWLQYRTVCKSWNITIKSFSHLSIGCALKDSAYEIFPNLTSLKINKKCLFISNLNLPTNLTKLSFSCNVNIDNLSLLTNLKTLSIDGNGKKIKGTIWMSNFQHLTNLTKLKLTDTNGFTVGFLTNLKFLKLISSTDTNPDFISRLTNLTSISLYDVAIKPDSVINLPYLTYIDSSSHLYFEKKCYGRYYSPYCKYFDFDEYVGGWFNCKPSGFGKSYNDNVLQYEGNWLDGTYHGSGIEFEKLKIVNGKWNYGVLHGMASITHVPTGKFFECEYIDGKKNGLGIGIFLSIDGSTYEGYWRDGEKHGHGIHTHKNGSVYDGEWQDNKKHGHGIYTYYGSRYDGEWLDDKQHGKGRVIFNEKSSYDGEWENNKIHGKGHYIYANGSEYIGDFNNGIKHGYGIYISKKHGSKYEGNWLFDKQNGYGICTYKDGAIYNGNWTNNKRNGIGQFTYQNGNIYEGEWKDNERHGSGEFIIENGATYYGNWSHNKKVYAPKIIC